MTQRDNRFESYYRRGTQLLQMGNGQEALPLLKKAYNLDRDHFSAALNLAGAYILTGRFKKALPLLEALREREPENAMVWTNLGAAYLGNPVLATEEKQEKAIDAFKQALEINPAAPSVAYNIGLIYRDRKDEETAIYWFRQALKHDPNDRSARSQLQRLLDAEDAS